MMLLQRSVHFFVPLITVQLDLIPSSFLLSESQMSLNNDFSFVRFLKVVKTLYESSVFTKIGKTVGTELDKQLPARDDDTVVDSVGSLETMPDGDNLDKKDKGLLCSIADIITCQPADYSDDEDTMGRNHTFDDSHYSR